MMTKTAPYNKLFEIAKKYDKRSNYFVYASTICTALIVIVDNNYKDSSYSFVLNLLNCVFIGFFVFYDILFNSNYMKGNIAKRLDLVDNSFGSNFSGLKSNDYFSNDKLSYGAYKLAVNAFENALFSCQIVKNMLFKSWLKSIIVLTFFVVSAYIGKRDIIVLLFQTALPLLLLQKSIKLHILSVHLNTILQNFRTLFNYISIHRKFDDKLGEALRNIIDYETALSWSSIQLDSKEFDKVNTELSMEWEVLKKEYNIECE